MHQTVTRDTRQGSGVFVVSVGYSEHMMMLYMVGAHLLGIPPHTEYNSAGEISQRNREPTTSIIYQDSVNNIT
jgi:hypothetical protein